MKLLKRIKPIQTQNNGGPIIQSNEDKALELVGGFLVMVETSLNGNKKFPIKSILSQWWKIAFVELMPLQDYCVQHTVVRIASRLYLKSCREFRVLPSKKFIKLNTIILGNTFLSYSINKVNKIAKLLAEHTKLEVLN